VAKRSHEDRRNTRIIGNNVTEKVAFLPGEFPEPGKKTFFRTFPYQNSPLVVKKNYGSINFLSKTLFSNRSELLGIMLESQTEIPYRTEATAGSTRCAYQGAQIHNCLIKETSFSPEHEGQSSIENVPISFPLLDGNIEIQKTSEYSLGVSIDGRVRKIVRNT
jgi:hypothetical protein